MKNIIISDDLKNEIHEQMRNGESRVNIGKFLIKEHDYDYNKIDQILNQESKEIDHQFKKELSLSGWRNNVLDGFRNNQNLSSEGFREILIESGLKRTRIDEYERYFFELFSGLSNINKSEPE